MRLRGSRANPRRCGAAPGAPPTAALVPGGIALQMAECDVVRRAGTPEKVDLGEIYQLAGGFFAVVAGF